MQLDEMHVALVSLAVHLLRGENFVKVKEEHGLVDDTVLGHHDHGSGSSS